MRGAAPFVLSLLPWTEKVSGCLMSSLLALPGCSIGIVLSTRVVGTVERRGKEVTDLALQGRDGTAQPTHQGVYKLSALEGGAGSWSS